MTAQAERSQQEVFSYRAESVQLLDLMIHSRKGSSK
jgi:hypothetical protein